MIEARIVPGDPAQASPLEQSAELVGVPVGVNRYAQHVHNEVLAAPVAVEYVEPGLIRRIRLRALAELERVPSRQGGDERVSSGRVRLPLRDFGSSIQALYSTSTLDWLTVSDDGGLVSPC